MSLKDDGRDLAIDIGFATAALLGPIAPEHNPGELIIEGDLNVRWMWWTLAMIPFLYVVHTLLIGLQDKIKEEKNEEVKQKLNMVCWATVISWCTYPIVYVFPMLGLDGPSAVVAIQLGYCVSDIISKCGVGFLIYNITIAKSNPEGYAQVH
jgi:bacteriorhodopsin